MTSPLHVHVHAHASPIGDLHYATSRGALVTLDFRADAARAYAGGRACDAACNPRVARALDAYFGGDLFALDALDVDAAGTPFQMRVWKRLRAIAPGETTSYGALAAALGAPYARAARAVGAANARNPVALVVPCHRVIGRGDRGLVGYAGGLERKKWLLDHEARFRVHSVA